jgi:mRNA-degrading endonuclease RelE of RelBE toxin-antitoxin system
MIFIETMPFARRRAEHMDEEGLRLMQLRLCADPESGDIIAGTGGLRKLRWSGRGRGKRGGLRVIYCWMVQPDVIMLLLVYPRNEQEELSTEQRRKLKELVEHEFQQRR